MATKSQITANRQNAQSSTGPRTEEGKHASSQNATKHGLSSNFAVLPHEDQSEFDDLLESYAQEFDPKTEHERYLIELMAQAAGAQTVPAASKNAPSMTSSMSTINRTPTYKLSAS